MACIYNVYGVGPEVETMAKELACQGQPSPCSAQYTRAERTPWAHTFKMYTSASSGERPISCQRQYIFVGDYSCQFKDGTSAPPNGTPSAVVKDAPASSGKAPITARPRSSGTSVPARFGPAPSATTSAP
ncbi:MAG: hypothetical protein IPM54_45030 [Polyangiaceae bacterium]|nr:hypothetical protein [Polyangiaceae bacterium]